MTRNEQAGTLRYMREAAGLSVSEAAAAAMLSEAMIRRSEEPQAAMTTAMVGTLTRAYRDRAVSPRFRLRTGLLADLQQPSAGALADRIGWQDTDGLRRALHGETCGADLPVALAAAYVPTPVAWFATRA